MVRRLMLLGFALLSCSVVIYAAATIKDLSLVQGYEEDNTIGTAVYDTSKVAPVVFTGIEGTFDPKELRVRKGNRTAPEYYLDPSIDLASMFAQALRAESQAMGFKPTGKGWEVSGVIHEIFTESHQVYMGATLSYGYIDVEFKVSGPGGGAAKTVPMKLHCFHGAYKERLNRQQEAREGIAHLLVEGAQEAVARLNRAYFKAPPSPAMLGLAAKLREPSANDLHLVGLSGATEAVQPLMRLLATDDEENVRFNIIAALGRIGATEVIPVLTGRYKDEDEDCRWATIKAFDYMGTEQSRSAAQRLGRGDDHYPCDRLAKRIAGS